MIVIFLFYQEIISRAMSQVSSSSATPDSIHWGRNKNIPSDELVGTSRE